MFCSQLKQQGRTEMSTRLERTWASRSSPDGAACGDAWQDRTSGEARPGMPARPGSGKHLLSASGGPCMKRRMPRFLYLRQLESKYNRKGSLLMTGIEFIASQPRQKLEFGFNTISRHTYAYTF